MTQDLPTAADEVPVDAMDPAETVYGGVGTDGAILQGRNGWKGERYQFTKDGQTTEWGDYHDVFKLNGWYYVSDYYTGAGTWLMLTAEQALDHIARKVRP